MSSGSPLPMTAGHYDLDMKRTLLKYFASWFLFSHTLPALAALINITVDDDGLDHVHNYNIRFSDGWTQNGPGCTNCGTQPDSSKASKNSWQSASYDPSNASSTPQTAALDFTGIPETSLSVHECSQRAPVDSIRAVYLWHSSYRTKRPIFLHRWSSDWPSLSVSDFILIQPAAVC